MSVRRYRVERFGRLALTAAGSVWEHDVKIEVNHRVNFHIARHKHVLLDDRSEELGQARQYQQSDALIEIKTTRSK